MSDPLELFADWVVNVLSLEPDSAAGEALAFFIYDSIKILILLFLMVFLMGLLRTYITPERIKKMLTHKTFGIPNTIASIFGAVTPFCSCSSIPIFMGFLEAGVPLGTSFSFLATSPLINEYVAVLMLGFFGWEVTAAYVFIGIILGTCSGIIIGKMNMEKYLVKDLAKRSKLKHGMKFKNFSARLVFAYSEARDILLKLWIWILVGVGLGAVIHGFIPEEAINSAFNAGGIFSVPLAVLVGIPIYANCSAVVPIAVAFFEKGAPLGTSLAFMMATAALSLPEAIILRRVMGLPLLAVFFSMIAAGIIIIGYLFNLIF